MTARMTVATSCLELPQADPGGYASATRTLGGRKVKRRSLLGGAAASAALLATGCLAPNAVETRRLRLGAISGEALPVDGSAPLVEQDVDQGLRDAGYLAGENMTIEWRHAQGNPGLYLVFANEFVELPVDVLIASPGTAVQVAKAATSAIPIVMHGCPDPIENGLIQSYSHPGGNVTGPAFSNVAEVTKRFELLREAFPATSRVLVIGNVLVATNAPAVLAELRRTSTAMGVELVAPELRTDDDVDGALNGASGADALLVFGSTLISPNIGRIVAFAAERRLPAVFAQEAHVRAGGLFSYASDRRVDRRRVGSYVRRIVEGARPGDLPVELPQKFDLAVNLGTARRAGLSIPRSLLDRATTVIP